jgi:hypothetical protein
MADTYEEMLKRLNGNQPTAPEVAAPVAVSEYDQMISRLNATEPTPEVVATGETPVVEPLPLAETNYSESDLIQDQFFLPIQNYMVDRFGEHMREADRADVIEKYTNNMRGFEGGNSVRTVNEVMYLNEISDDENRMSTAGEAYKIYQGMQGVFGDTTLGEKAEAVWDFTRSTVADPVNLIGLGIGKVATGTGFRLGSQAALIAAKRAFEKELAGGAVREAAQAAGQKIFEQEVTEATAKTVARITQRQAVEQGAKTTLQRMTTSIALKEAAVVGTFEAAVAAGTDYLYQDVMLRTKVQDEYNVYQTGLSAVVGLVAGGIAGAASNVGTGRTGLKVPPELKNEIPKGNKTLGKLVNQTSLSPNPDLPEGNWLADIADGKDLSKQDIEFFIKMQLGDSDKGIKGLAQIALEEGYTWARTGPDGKVSNWIGDVIKQADPADAKQFLADFTKVTGITKVDGKKITIEALGDTFKKRMRESAQNMNAARQISDILGGNLKGRTVDDYVGAVMDGGVPETSSVVREAIGKFTGDLLNRDLPDLQNNIIRLMVANPSTTLMNVTGYAAMTGLNSATDIARAVLFGGKAGLYLAYKPAEAKKAGITALNLLQNQVVKARSILDINTTYDQFLLYSKARPQVMDKLTAVLSGGVEKADTAIKGFDPDTPLLTLRANQVSDLAQTVALGNAQDGATKAIEFFAQLDKLIRRPREEGGYGMSYADFISDKAGDKIHPAAKMMSERYVKLEAKAVDETLKATFGKSYKGQGALGEVAGAIEDARKIPGIGLLVPFGRFFNNTVALMYETTAVGPLFSRLIGKDDRPFEEIFVRGAVTWGLIGTLAQREAGYLDMGLSWSEEIDENTGAVLDEKYEFPYGLYKAAARASVHLYRDGGIPPELVTQLRDQFGLGQLTRQLETAGEDTSKIIDALLSEDGPSFAKMLLNTMGGVASQAVSGITRPLEPINAIVGLGRDEEFYVPDRKQGPKAFNQALRYMDQLQAVVVGGNTMPPLYSAVEGQPRQNISKLISTTRESRLTATEQVMNAIGRPSYKAGMSSESDVADNRYNQLFDQMVEEEAKVLRATKSFREGDLAYKTMRVTDILSKARKATKAYMGSIAAKSGDRVLVKMIEISNTPTKTIQSVLKDLKIDRNLDQLSEEELDTVANTIKYREEIVKQRNE